MCRIKRKQSTAGSKENLNVTVITETDGCSCAVCIGDVRETATTD